MDKKNARELQVECLKMLSEDCWSVRAFPKKWEWFNELISLHPYFPDNVIGFYDIRICEGKMFLAFFDEDVPFSWKMCCIRPKRYYRREAMRGAVHSQVEEFRRGAIQACPCGSAGPFHVDHVVFFADLCREFEASRDDVPDDIARLYGTGKWYQATFSGGSFADDWVKFHRENAVLRMLCKTCNLTREKPRRA